MNALGARMLAPREILHRGDKSAAQMRMHSFDGQTAPRVHGARLPRLGTCEAEVRHVTGAHATDAQVTELMASGNTRDECRAESHGRTYHGVCQKHTRLPQWNRAP